MARGRGHSAYWTWDGSGGNLGVEGVEAGIAGLCSATTTRRYAQHGVILNSGLMAL